MTKRFKILVKRIPGKSSREEISPGETFENLLKKLGINRETVVVRRNGRLVAESEKISPGDKVEIVSIISGG
ncbi:MAG: sulfur carrier protein ThiS [archaeon]